MAEPARRMLEYDDLLAHDAPAGARPELVDGRIVYKASPRGPHSRAQARVAGHLMGADRDEGGWWILTEQDVRLTRHRILRPDVAGWRRERMPVVPDEGPIEVAPDWVCEVLSPGHEAHDTKTKRDLYREHEVRWYWLVHPSARTLEAFELRDGAWVLLGTWTDGDTARVPPFVEISLDVGDLFLPLRPGA